MLLDTRREFYVAVVWDGQAYSLRVPQQEVSGASVRYEALSDVVAEMHSHGTMGAFFSSTDDADEKGFRVYGVVGKLDLPTPEMNWRAGAYGYFHAIEWENIFT